MKILIAEDDLISRKVMKKFVEDYGEYDIVVNGREAIEMFKQSLEEEEPYNIIFLDVMMPEIDGFNVLKRVREIEEEYNIKSDNKVKIIMTTALGESKNIIDAFRDQCDDYIVKPVEREKVMEILNNFSKQVI